MALGAVGAEDFRAVSTLCDRCVTPGGGAEGTTQIRHDKVLADPYGVS